MSMAIHELFMFILVSKQFQCVLILLCEITKFFTTTTKKRGNIREDRIQNEKFHSKIVVTHIDENMRKSRLRWFSCVKIKAINALVMKRWSIQVEREKKEEKCIKYISRRCNPNPVLNYNSNLNPVMFTSHGNKNNNFYFYFL